jgi:hypothetical protein
VIGGRRRSWPRTESCSSVRVTRLSRSRPLRLKRLDKITDWSGERIAYELERFNGWGYRLHHPTTLSPYLWSGSQHYARGKYIADGVWSSTSVSQQIGAMVVLQQLAMLTTIDVREPRHRRSPIITRSAAQDRLARLIRRIFACDSMDGESAGAKMPQ